VGSSDEGAKISPEYATESKAEAFAIKWMKKHPKGVSGPSGRVAGHFQV
jgi:hypothetical protein